LAHLTNTKVPKISTLYSLSLVGSGSVGQESLSELLGRGTEELVGKRETDLAVVELLNGGSAGLGSGHFIDRDNLNTAETSSVSSSKILVQLLNSADSAGVSVFLVHVLSASSAVVSQDNTVVLDGEEVLLEDLSDGQDFTAVGLDLSLSGKEVPETTLGVDGAL